MDKKHSGRPAMDADTKRRGRSFKATNEEWQAIKKLAKQAGMGASGYIRKETLKKIVDRNT